MEKEAIKAESRFTKIFKGLFFKGGKFSKTAFFASLANIAILVTYVVQSWFAGSSVDFTVVQFVIPQFDAANAGTILALLNGTYLGNNMLKSKESSEGSGG
jgi:hypothetical protein